MSRAIQSILATVILILFFVHPIAPGPVGNSPTRSFDLIELLPDSTLLVVEIRELSTRWQEVRGIPAIDRFLDRLFSEGRLGPDNLPRLAGERAVLALVTGDNGRTVLPVALLHPPRAAEAEAVLTDAALNGLDGTALAVRRGRGALWIGPGQAAGRIESLAAGDESRLDFTVLADEVNRRLPQGGLVRGWVNVDALRTLLHDRVEGGALWPLEIVRAFATAGLDAVRFAGFRRELTSDGVVTDAVIGIDRDRLPAEVARVFESSPGAPRVLPSPLPQDVVLAASFGIEAKAMLAWIRHVAAADPRGPLRNLDFWLDEFEQLTGHDLERDLVGELGERAWFFFLNGEAPGTIQALLVLETRATDLVERVLLDFRSWLVEHMWGRTLGVVAPRVRDDAVNGRVVHGLTFRTPFAELPGPAFVAMDGQIVIGTGKSAVRAGLELLRTRDTWVQQTRPAPHESIRVRGAALASLIDALLEQDSPAWTGLLDDLESISADVWYEDDAVRIRGRVDFGTDG